MRYKILKTRLKVNRHLGLILVFLLALAVNCLAATEVVKIVDPDNGPGTDYTSLSAWEAGEQGNLVDDDKIAIAKCRNTGGSADTTALEIRGWTTDTDHYIKIWTDPNEGYRHDGTAGTGYRLDITDGSQVIYIRESHVKIFGLELTGSGTEYGFYAAAWESIDDIELAYNLIHDLGGTDASSGGITFGTSTRYISNLKFYNNIIYNIGGSGFHSKSASSNSGNIFNNTIFNCNKSNNVWEAGIRDESGQFVFKNNAVFDSGNKDYYGNEATQNGGSNNASSDDTGNSGLQNLSSSNQFVDTTDGSEDLHLKSGADLIDAGTDLSSYFTDDIDGDTRSGTWDIGADEYVSAAAPTKVQVIIISKNNLGRR